MIIMLGSRMQNLVVFPWIMASANSLYFPDETNYLSPG